MKTSYIFTLFLILNAALAVGQVERSKGKIITDFGQTFEVENPDIKTDINTTLKVIFDVSKSSEDTTQINSYLVTAARFLNMHADAGMNLDQLKVAITVHGSAWKDMLNDTIYMEKYGSKNPNTELLNQLNEAGVDIIMCGQTAAYRKVSKSDSNANVKFALSAMTALLQYQNNGYRFIKF